MIKLRFTNPRSPEYASDLSLTLQGQIRYAGQLYDGDELPAAKRLNPTEYGDDESSFYGFVTLWDLVDEHGDLQYEAWFYRADSGTIFEAGSTTVAAEVIQCGLECEDEDLEYPLKAARMQALLEYVDEAKEITFC